MRCPYCGHDETRVTDSRTSDDGVRRRRECLECAARFTTYERLVAPAQVMVIKKDGRREPFSREKILRGIVIASQKRPLSAEEIGELVDGIETAVNAYGRPEVDSELIGELVMDRLQQIDQIAYIRFASVYRAFADIETLKEAVEALERAREMGDPSAQLPLFPDAADQLTARGHLVAIRGNRDDRDTPDTGEAPVPPRPRKRDAQ
jgi:transcriptional repressor NrdR